MTVLTNSQKNKYLKHPYHCPYCESEDIESVEGWFTSKNRRGEEAMHCKSCGQHWVDIYKLTNVVEQTFEVGSMDV